MKGDRKVYYYKMPLVIIYLKVILFQWPVFLDTLYINIYVYEAAHF